MGNSPGNPESATVFQDFFAGESGSHFGVFHELMGFRVQEILLVSSAYDAYIMEEDGSLAMRIIHEYHGLNLSRPPRITRVSSVEQALELLADRSFDLVLTMPRLGGMDCHTFAGKVKERDPELPVILLAHSVHDALQLQEQEFPCFINDTYVWCCDSNLLLAIVKNIEDRQNVDADTARAMVRVILFVEDSPVHRSQILPILYNEVVKQTQAVLDEGLNDQHRLLKMRARPKILVAGSFEEAVRLLKRYRHHIFALLTDVRFPKNGSVNKSAGMELLAEARRELPDLPILVMSTDPANKKLVRESSVMFALKDPSIIGQEIRTFFLNYLGFGDFVFRLPDGTEVARAENMHEFERELHQVPDASLLYHARCNHFSNWVMARAEVALASRLNRLHFAKVTSPDHLREDIIFKVHALRRLRQKGVVSQFSREGFDPEVTDFARMGRGSMGGKARGIAFISSLLQRAVREGSPLAEVSVQIPQTCVITTEGFDDFVALNQLEPDETLSDQEIADLFIQGKLPGWLADDLRAYLGKVDYPLSVRSSSMLEDAQFRPYAGLYSTFMLVNGGQDVGARFVQLERAVKLVYASTWFEGPRSFSRSINQQNQDSMAVILQRLVGKRYGDNFYPAVSGTVQSYNFYPVPPMKAGDGIGYVALGFGRTVVEGEQSLRICPRYPENIPQLSSIEDMLENTQRAFYSLDCSEPDRFEQNYSNLIRRDIGDAQEEYPVKLLGSTYFPDEGRVRDADLPGPKVLTFASLLKYNLFPLPGVMAELGRIGKEGMGCEVEIEFALDLDKQPDRSVFYFLQIRPMAVAGEGRVVEISAEERRQARLYSPSSLGHGLFEQLHHIVFVKPDSFDPAKTVDIAAEVSVENRWLVEQGLPYILLGFGRWGSADPWLGIPVRWHDISGAGAIVEMQGQGISAEPSQGSHFFQNITSLGIPYLMIEQQADGQDLWKEKGGADWDWLRKLELVRETRYLCHVESREPLLLKVNGRKGESVLLQHARTR